MIDIHDKATRQSLINKYMEAETSLAEERLLADYFLDNECVDEDERAFAALIRMEKRTSSRRTLPLRWLALTGGIAASVILFFALYSPPKKPDAPKITQSQQQKKEPNALELVQSLQQIMELPMQEITSLTATPIGEYVWVKAQFADGTEETFIIEKDKETMQIINT